ELRALAEPQRLHLFRKRALGHGSTPRMWQLACFSRAKTTLFARGPDTAPGALAEMATGHFSQLNRHQRQHPQRATGTVDDLQRRCDDDRSGRRQLIEIHQARQAELVRAVHDRVAREHRLEARRLAGIRADGLDANAEDIPLAREERDTLWMEARRMGPVGPNVEHCLGAAAL